MITITSDYGQIGNFCWMNSNQDYQIEITHDVTGKVIQTLPAWWGCCWREGSEPTAYLNMIATVLAMLMEANEPQE
jgi:hypothetical protein